MGRFGGIALALLLAFAAACSPDASPQVQKCTTPVANTANPGCGDANRGMILYGQVPTAGVPQTWACNQCHSANPLTDTMNMPAPAPSLIRAAPRDPGYIDYIMHYQPNALPIITAMETCCIADRPPNNVMGDLGDLAEFLYTCKIGIAPCVTGGGGGGGGGGGTSPGALQGAPSILFGSVAMGSASSPVMLTLTNVGATRVTVASVATSNAAEFPIVSNGCGSVDPFGSCDVALAFRPSALGSRSAAVTVTSDGVGSPQAFSLSGTAVASFNYEGLWWVDKGAEDGWGVNLAHQGDSVFATWYTYDTSGTAWWLSMLATKVAGTTGTFTGPILLSHGSAFNAMPFVPISGNVDVGSGTKGTLTFSDGGHASFDYTVNGVHQAKTIVRFDLGPGPPPTCTENSAPDYAGASNYQNLWWALGGGESGWGINLIHQGDSIFATWYTYDTNGLPLWLSALLAKTGPGVYEGSLLRTSGPRFDAYVGPPKKSDAGTLKLTFANGNLATMDSTVKNVAPGAPVTQSKQITRFVFGSVPTLCQ